MKHFSASQRWMLKHFGSWGREQRGQKTHSAYTLKMKKNTHHSPYIFQRNRFPHPLEFWKKKDPQLCFTLKPEQIQHYTLTFFDSNSGKIYSTFKRRFLHRVQLSYNRLTETFQVTNDIWKFRQVTCKKPHVLTLSLVITQGTQNFITVYFIENYCIHLFKYYELWKSTAWEDFHIWLYLMWSFIIFPPPPQHWPFLIPKLFFLHNHTIFQSWIIQQNLTHL